MSGPALQIDDDKTMIPPDPRVYRRQQKIARQQRIKQTLKQLRDSDDLFLNNSITLAEGPTWPKTTPATKMCGN
jgi:hypothetical protein